MKRPTKNPMTRKSKLMKPNARKTNGNYTSRRKHTSIRKAMITIRKKPCSFSSNPQSSVVALQNISSESCFYRKNPSQRMWTTLSVGWKKQPTRTTNTLNICLGSSTLTVRTSNRMSTKRNDYSIALPSKVTSMRRIRWQKNTYREKTSKKIF